MTDAADHWHPPLPPDLLTRPALALNLGRDNAALADVDVANAEAFGRWIARQAAAAGCDWAVGGYGEDRAIYAMSPLFSGDATPRSVHLGVDFWMPARTPVFAVADGVVHSTADNAGFGDYGPTIILAHDTSDGPIHTLYGHLARESLAQVQPGDAVRAGQHIGWLGTPSENVGWPPHLHFQIIRDMGERTGDYPGVCHAEAAEHWLAGCPDPAKQIAAWCPDIRTG